MLAVIVGFLFMVIGLWGIIAFWQNFLNAIIGLLPLMFFFGGSIAAISGFTSIRDSLESRGSLISKSEQKADERV